MLEKKPIQVSRYKIDMPKYSAITTMEEYISAHTDEFLDGEEIILKYKDIDDEWVSSNAIVNINENSAITLDVEIVEKDTVKIIESDDEPEDKDSLWLVEAPSGETMENYKQKLIELQEQVNSLQALVERHDYVFRGTANSGEITSGGTMAGGDIITNSQKYYLENAATPEEPEDEDTVYTSGDTHVSYFEIHIGNTEFYEYYSNTTLYKGQKFYLKFKFFNQGEEEIDIDDSDVVSTSITSNNISVADFISGTSILVASKSGSTDIFATITLTGGTIIDNTYPAVVFEYNEEPYYERYEEPNVHHLLIKSAGSTTILNENLNYLCAGELIWCVGDNSLYYYGKVASGSIQLVKITGSGGGTGSTITYKIDETTNILTISGSTASISAGMIKLTSGAKYEDGILKLTTTNN